MRYLAVFNSIKLIIKLHNGISHKNINGVVGYIVGLFTYRDYFPDNLPFPKEKVHEVPSTTSIPYN